MRRYVYGSAAYADAARAFGWSDARSWRALDVSSGDAEVTGPLAAPSRLRATSGVDVRAYRLGALAASS